MSLITRHQQRLSSPFSEVRQGARDEVLMIVAGSTGVVSVAGAITFILMATGAA